MNIDSFIEKLANVKFKNVFNPYVDVCRIHDDRQSPSIRANNLRSLLRAIPEGMSTMWIGRDLGYKGARRTGIPLTDEAHIPSFISKYNKLEVMKATTTAVVAERTASEVWKIIELLEEPPLLWNVFPFHPHEPDDEFSNRSHTSLERKTCSVFIEILIEIFKPRAVIAIGNDAYKALSDMGYEPLYVRHPSYGGQTEFLSGMNKIYRLRNNKFQLT